MNNLLFKNNTSKQLYTKRLQIIFATGIAVLKP